jgi:TetR/AcrR family transcriptional regulator, tetracycline repressor protein
VLRTAGFSVEEASAIARAALWTGLALVMSEPGIELLDDTERAEVQRKKQVELAMLPPSKYPRLVEAAIPMTACDDPELHYRFGVELFIAGVEAIAARR